MPLRHILGKFRRSRLEYCKSVKRLSGSLTLARWQVDSAKIAFSAEGKDSGIIYCEPTAADDIVVDLSV